MMNGLMWSLVVLFALTGGVVAGFRKSKGDNHIFWDFSIFKSTVCALGGALIGFFVALTVVSVAILFVPGKIDLVESDKIVILEPDSAYTTKERSFGESWTTLTYLTVKNGYESLENLQIDLSHPIFIRRDILAGRNGYLTNRYEKKIYDYSIKDLGWVEFMIPKEILRIKSRVGIWKGYVVHVPVNSKFLLLKNKK